MTDTVPPIRREIVVDADPATAFEVFTAGIGQWWPIDELSVGGAGGTVEVAGRRIVEHMPSGATTTWGEIDQWEPGSAVAFTWHPGKEASAASHVEVRFRAEGEGRTLVTLVHTGWGSFADPAIARAEYDRGWPPVLERYRAQVPLGRPSATWVALLHRPGPSAPTTGTVFEDPRFAEHAAFLARMRAAGYLVAAGPLADRDGEGMTVLRLPGAGRLAEATALASSEDRSVTEGLLSVQVRPWQVMLAAE